jgi:NAD(P)-dependent dehydrogenase (short-subunit alcohol dehydrogenase family)
MSFALDLANRRALVNAGTKGVGAAVVKTLAEAGVRIVTTARTAPRPMKIGTIASRWRYDTASEITRSQVVSFSRRPLYQNLHHGRWLPACEPIRT